ncbi:MAG: undecaprenyldiphospho-muramoylpentapeptide beta-N-acetylglucosaminyltransferase [Pseudomonadota bacterium]
MSERLVLIMAGGTGGHIFPALAVATALRDLGQRVLWLGSPLGMEAKIVAKAGIDMEWLPVKGLRRKGIVAWLLAPIRLARSIFLAVRILRRANPAVVLGMGGYVAGPGGIGAWLLRKPLLIHEQNAVAGLTNRILSRFARQIFEAFPGSFGERSRAETIGNPVRHDIIKLEDPSKRFATRTGSPRLLILGGSQGALVLNQVVPLAIGALPSSIRPEIWHQTGEATLETAISQYQSVGIKAKVDAFLDDMSEAYAWADLVICRAGALTIAELTAVGLGAILVPYPSAVDDHQTKNALFMVNAGAGILIQQDEFEANRVAQELEPLFRDRQPMQQMATAARSVGVNNASLVLAQACLDYLPAESTS